MACLDFLKCSFLFEHSSSLNFCKIYLLKVFCFFTVAFLLICYPQPINTIGKYRTQQSDHCATRIQSRIAKRLPPAPFSKAERGRTYPSFYEPNSEPFRQVLTTFRHSHLDFDITIGFCVSRRIGECENYSGERREKAKSKKNLEVFSTLWHQNQYLHKKYMDK